MMGRYFLCHMHPLSVAELTRQTLPWSPLRPPAPLREPAFRRLWTNGGFPKPFLKHDAHFSELWRLDRLARQLREDIRKTPLIQNMAKFEKSSSFVTRMQPA